MKTIYKPPKLAGFIVRQVLPDDKSYTPLGDFEEYYNELAAEKGVAAAYIWYWAQTFNVLARRIGDSTLWAFILLMNFIKFSFRSLKKNKLYSIINFSGLVVGMTASLLIYLYVNHELNHDKFNINHERIYRVSMFGLKQQSMSPAIGDLIARNISSVEKVVRLKKRGDYITRYRPDGSEARETLTSIKHFAWADSTFFEVFSFDFIFGSREDALIRSFSIILTETTSAKLFGESDPVGKTILVDDRNTYTVTGVVRERHDFQYKFDALASFITLGDIIGQHELDSYRSWNLTTYVMLHENADPDETAQRITEYFTPIFDQQFEWTANFALHNLVDAYYKFSTHTSSGNLSTVYMFSGVAMLILLLACLNFVNLTTSRSTLRAREIGVKKAVGTTNGYLIWQFLSESVLFSILSFIVTLAIAYLVLPAYGDFIGKTLQLNVLFNSFAGIFVVAAVILVGISAGLYPAFHLTRFVPSEVLRGSVTKGKQSAKFRQGMILFQFAISIALIITTLTVFRQLDYVRNMSLGFNKELVINFNYGRSEGIRNRPDEFRQALLKNPKILNVSFSQGYPGFIYNWESFEHKGKRNGFAVFTVDPSYFDLFGFEFIDGRPFSWDIKTDQLRTCIMNEAAVKAFNLENPVGHIFHKNNRGNSSFPVTEVEVIGVVKDFHFQTLHSEIVPLVFSWNPGWLWNASVRIAPDNIRDSVNFLELIWNEFSPDTSLEYTFLDDSFNALYEDDERFGQIIGWFAGLAVFVAGLGLFGVATFFAEQRTKEIGIRKVLGASTATTTAMLVKDFIKWVLAANLVAWPAAWYLGDYWLSNFAFREEQGFILYVLATGIAVVIAVLTVGWQSVKASSANPVNSLRHE